MDVGSYIHNFEGFGEKVHIPNVYKLGIRNNRHLRVPMQTLSFLETLLFILFLSWRRALMRRFNCILIVWILLEVEILKNYKNSPNEH